MLQQFIDSNPRPHERMPTFQWSEEIGLGYHPLTAVPEEVYDGEYWSKYQRYTDTEIGRKLTKARCDLVLNYANPHDKVIVDVGIGAGDFVLAMDCFGTDINPIANDWLKIQGKYLSLHDRSVDCITLWDVIEHFPDPSVVLDKAKEFVFISTPIYANRDQVLASKHMKVSEHCWYPTWRGMEHFMSWFGFELVYKDDRETQIGRESIGSFVFKRT